MNNNNYIRLSLELHLFFDRIMKEHSLFLETSFLEIDDEFKRIAQKFKQTFSTILEDVVKLADGNIRESLLSSEEIVTKNTLAAEKKTSELSGSNIDTNITLKELNLGSGNVIETPKLINIISQINQQTLPIINNLIHFKNDILNKVLSCKMYTTNYPLLISHIMNEAKMYYNLLNKLEKREAFTETDIYEQEIFWNNIMKEHAEFIRGLLDPSEEELILTSDKYAYNYKKILKNYQNDPLTLTNVSLTETINFRNFQVTGEEGILSCQIKSIIIPLLADHIIREANHFIRILKSINVQKNTY